MLISDKYKLILLLSPKIASMSLRTATRNWGRIFGSNGTYHNTAFAGEEAYPNEWKEYFTVGFSRNPFDRMVSLFHDFRNVRKQIPMSRTFSDWLDSFDIKNYNVQHFKPQSWFLGHNGTNKEIAVKFLGRYERIQEDWDIVLEFLRLPSSKSKNSSKLKVLRKSNHLDYREYYTKEKTADIVRSLYDEDFEFLGYSKDVSNMSILMTKEEKEYFKFLEDKLDDRVNRIENAVRETIALHHAKAQETIALHETKTQEIVALHQAKTQEYRDVLQKISSLSWWSRLWKAKSLAEEVLVK